MGHWIINTLRRYNKFNDLIDGKNEKSLFHLSAAMMRILNNYQEVNLSQLHRYESEMLGKALEVFSEYCLGQMETARLEINIEKKAEIIEDIEDSVVKMFDVMRNVIEGTGGIDWQYIQSPSVSTSLYQVSPKYWSFYMTLVQKLSSVFNTEKVKYAFVLQPTLKNCIETELLLEKKDTSGKVVILYVPVYEAENVKYVSICLIHEMFHVLTKEERRRKARAAAFMSVAYLSLKKIIFEDVVLDEKDCKRDRELKEHLFASWMEDVLQSWGSMEQLSEGDKLFYSKNILKKVGEVFWDQLYKSREYFARDVFMARGLRTYEVLNTYEEFEKECNEAEEIVRKLEFNLSSIECQKKWIYTLKMLMEMFRESYADMLTNILTKIDSHVYQDAFLETAFFDYVEEEYDSSGKQLRMMLVAKALSEMESADNKWKAFSEEQRVLLNRKDLTETKCENDLTKLGKDYVCLGFTSEMEDIYLDYLKGCAESFKKKYENDSTVKEFQENFRHLVNKGEMDILFDVLESNAEYLEGEKACVQ